MTDLALPNPSAMGFLKGKLVDFDETSRGILELESGARIPCSVTGQIKAKIAKLRDRDLIWTVYPTASKNGLALKIRSKAGKQNQDKDGIMLIRGAISRIRENEIFVEVWSVERKRYYLVVVEGYLKAEVGQYWGLEAAVEGNKLILIDGEKLADKFNPDDFSSTRKPLVVTVLDTNTTPETAVCHLEMVVAV